jgi:hypothetical protein
MRPIICQVVLLNKEVVLKTYNINKSMVKLPLLEKRDTKYRQKLLSIGD